MPPNQQPIPPVQPQPQDNNFNFVPNPAAQPPAPVQPVAPVVDPAITQLQTDIAEIKTALTQPQQPQAPQPPVDQNNPPKYLANKYDDWGAVETDTAAMVNDIIDTKLQEVQTQNQQVNQQATEQEQKNQQYIDNTVGQLRTAGYLPPVTNQFDANDPGKQAENELLGYAIYGLGSTDLVKAAQELKFRHDAGFQYDHTTKQFVQVNPPSNNPMDNTFGNPPANPDQPQPFQPAPPQFMPPNQPVGPTNPYMPRQYPPGFNAPVSSGNSYMGTQNGVPTQRMLRGNSYDSLVEQFNRTQQSKKNFVDKLILIDNNSSQYAFKAVSNGFFIL